jgi:hypothetical protein
MARTTPKPPTRKIRNWPARLLADASIALSAPFSSRPNCASIQGRRADRFVERWQKLDHTRLSQYQAGDMAGYYRATRSAMGDMARSLERDPQMESILANRKRELGISFESGRRLGHELAFTHGLDLGRGRGLGI